MTLHQGRAVSLTSRLILENVGKLRISFRSGRLALEQKRVIDRSINHAGQSFQLLYGIEIDQGSGTY